MREEWRDFQGGAWENKVNVDDFIQKNFTPYDGDASFLTGATQNTKDLWAQVMALTKEERASIHGNNEKIPLETVTRAVEFFIRLMKLC